MPEITSAKLSIDPDLLPRGPLVRVIDVGCGDGRHLRAAAARGCYAVGIDYDLAALRATRSQLTAHRPQIVAADAAHLPFGDGAFDVAICTETLEHLPDDRAAVREITRVLAAGGMLLGAVPSHFTERVYWALSRGYRSAPGGHVRIYTPRQLAETLRDAGLSMTAIGYAHFVDSIVWLRFCLTDFLRPARPRSDFEAAVLLAIAEGRPVSTWRTNMRRALGRSRFLALLDVIGALVWPKSLLFTARKVTAHASQRSADHLRSPEAAVTHVEPQAGR
jgi:SAM-dependent methyltransferase